MEIVKIPHKILSEKTKNIVAGDVKKGLYKDLISDMRVAMVENNGVGLAANQIGKDLSIFVIDTKTADAYKVPEAYFNPERTEYSADMDETEEGCLSVPDYWTPIKRAKKIKIKFIDEDGIKHKIKAKGFLARVLQHETDHLNGLTIKERHNEK